MDVLRRVGERRQLPPTIIFNEGWLLRLILDAADHVRPQNHPLSFSDGATWFSEAHLPTAFRRRKQIDKLGEAHTHADGVIGHIADDLSGRGYLKLAPSATQFVVIEAKMFSRLSGGVRNAATFNQAARTVASMAQLLRYCTRPASDFESLAFYVIAPRERIDAGVFRLQMARDHIRLAVEARAASYGDGTARWHAEWFTSLVEQIRLECLSWESILETVEPLGVTGHGELVTFYGNCLKFNRPG